MRAFYSIALIVLFALAFMFFFFLIEKLKGINFIAKWTKNKILKDAIEGVIFGFFILIWQIINKSIFSESYLYIFVIGFTIVSILKSPFQGVCTIFPGMIYYLLEYKVTPNLYLSISISFAIVFLYEIVSYFYSGFKPRALIYMIGWVILFLAIIISIYAYHNAYDSELIDGLILTIIGSTIVDAFLYWILKISVSANVLYNSAIYAFSNYLREPIKNKIIGDFILENRPKYGLYGLFNIKTDTSMSDSEKKRVLEEQVLKKIEKLLPKNTIFFQSDVNTYGMFLKFDELNNLGDWMSENFSSRRRVGPTIIDLENAMNLASGEYEFSLVKTMIHVSVGVSIYNVQSSSLEELDSNAKLARSLTNRNYTNPVFVYNPIVKRRILNDRRELNELERIMPLSKISFEKINIFDKNNNSKIVLFWPLIDDSDMYEDLFEYSNLIEQKNIFERYSFSESLKRVDNTKKSLFAICYPERKIWEKDFQNYFIQNISKISINIDRLIIVFSELDLARSKSRIRYLKSLGLKIGFIVKDKNSIPNYNFDFVFFLDQILHENIDNINYKKVLIEFNKDNAKPNNNRDSFDYVGKLEIKNITRLEK